MQHLQYLTKHFNFPLELYCKLLDLLTGLYVISSIIQLHCLLMAHFNLYAYSLHTTYINLIGSQLRSVRVGLDDLQLLPVLQNQDNFSVWHVLAEWIAAQDLNLQATS